MKSDKDITKIKNVTFFETQRTYSAVQGVCVQWDFEAGFDCELQ